MERALLCGRLALVHRDRRAYSDCVGKGKAIGWRRYFVTEVFIPIAFRLLEFQKVHGGDEEDQGKAEQDQALGNDAGQAKAVDGHTLETFGRVGVRG